MARNELKAILAVLNSSAQKRGRFELTHDGVVYCQGLMMIDVPEDQVREFYAGVLRKDELIGQLKTEETFLLAWAVEYLGDPLSRKYLAAVTAGRELDEAEGLECEKNS